MLEKHLSKKHFAGLIVLGSLFLASLTPTRPPQSACTMHARAVHHIPHAQKKLSDHHAMPQRVQREGGKD